jgi:hypothetical protein
MGWDWFETATARWPFPQPRIDSPLHGWSGSMRVIPGRAGCGKPQASIREGEAERADLLDRTDDPAEAENV